MVSTRICPQLIAASSLTNFRRTHKRYHRVACRCHVMNEWAELVTSWSRGVAVYDTYRYAFSRLLSVGVVARITFVDTAATCHPVAKDATPCDDGLTDGCPHQTPVSTRSTTVQSTTCVIFHSLEPCLQYIHSLLAIGQELVHCHFKTRKVTNSVIHVRSHQMHRFVLRQRNASRVNEPLVYLLCNVRWLLGAGCVLNYASRNVSMYHVSTFISNLRLLKINFCPLIIYVNVRC